MAGKAKGGRSAQAADASEVVTLRYKPKFTNFKLWIVGDTPLITHAWSHKAKLAMYEKQKKKVRGGREARDPQADFVSSLYDMGDGRYGFPVTGIKKAILGAAHKDKGVEKTLVMRSLFFHAEMVRVMPALAGSICDLPLVQIYGGEPEMREDMVRVGAGLNKTATLAYRGQFTVWGVRLRGRYNAAAMEMDTLAVLIEEAGISSGLGEWRNERNGIFGAFRLATAEEEAEWEAYAAGTGPLPVPYQYAQAAE